MFSDQNCLRPPDVVMHEDCDMPVQYNALQSVGCSSALSLLTLALQVAQFEQARKDGTGGVSAILCEIRQQLQVQCGLCGCC